MSSKTPKRSSLPGEDIFPGGQDEQKEHPKQSTDLSPTILQQTQTRMINPFRHRLQPDSKRVRQHFPGFDRAMALQEEAEKEEDEGGVFVFPASSSTGSPNNHSSSNKEDKVDKENLNQSRASSSTGGSSSCVSSSALNLSIGARAALNEHLRHVSKFGLDGNSDDSNNRNSNSITNNPKQTTRSMTPPRNPLDAIWDHLLDSTTQTFFPLTSSSPAPSLNQSMDVNNTVVSVSSGDIEGSEAIEVAPKVEIEQAPPDKKATSSDTFSACPTTAAVAAARHPISLFPWDHHKDVFLTDHDNQSKSSKSSSSYFNSSRVYQLRTPERNFAAVAELEATQRNLDYAAAPQSPPSILEESTICGSDHTGDIPMAHLFRALTTGHIPGGGRPPSSSNASQMSSPTPNNPLDRSFASFIVATTEADVSRISGYAASPDTSFQPDTSFEAYPPQSSSFLQQEQQQRPNVGEQEHVFSSWDEQDNAPFLDEPSPPPTPPQQSRLTTYQEPFHPTRQETSWSSLPAARTVQRSPSPRTKDGRPVLIKQNSCPVSGYRTKQRHISERSKDAAIFSEVAQNAGLVALAKQDRLTRQTTTLSPPTHTLMDFFQEYALPAAGDDSVDLSSPQRRRHTNNLNQSFPSPDLASPIQPSVDDISTIQNDSSSGGQHNVSSSSSSYKRQMQTSTISHQQYARSAQKVNVAAATPSTALLNRSNLSSSSASSSGIKPVDRRRYRTVVPSRVFLKQEPAEGYFPVARDSFSSTAVSGKKGTRRRRASAGGALERRRQEQEEDEASALLETSFEAAHLHSLQEDTQKLRQRSL